MVCGHYNHAFWTCWIHLGVQFLVGIIMHQTLESTGIHSLLLRMPPYEQLEHTPKHSENSVELLVT